MKNCKGIFEKLYGAGGDIRCFAASGRVNIIGEHIDYNGGNVFPAAISLGCFIYARQNGKNQMNLAFTTTDKTGTIDYSRLDEYKKTPYINYQAGVLDELCKEGVMLTGLDVLYDITVPFGSGLSSSAAIEVATAFMLTTLSNEKAGKEEKIDLVKLSKLCQRAENQYVGVNCGIMDQFASANGKRNKAMLLDCSKVEFEYVDLDLKDYELVIINTNKPHNLVTSKYNERRHECEVALRLLKDKKADLHNICQLDEDEFYTLAYVLNGKVLNRATHCVMEQARVKKAVEAMKSGDIELLGQLLLSSHHSLKDLYEVSCPELDTIVEFCEGFELCVGGRMTGAGFGGSCIAIVKKSAAADFIAKLQAHYKKVIGYDCSIYEAEIWDGAREL